MCQFLPLLLLPSFLLLEREKNRWNAISKTIKHEWKVKIAIFEANGLRGKRILFWNASSSIVYVSYYLIIIIKLLLKLLLKIERERERERGSIMELKKMWNVAKGNKFACRQGLNGRLFPPLGEEMEKWFFRLQTDYDRHLEELLERVEGLLIGILRKNLRKENLDQVAHYHALLENVRHLSKGESLLYWNHLIK